MTHVLLQSSLYYLLAWLQFRKKPSHICLGSVGVINYSWSIIIIILFFNKTCRRKFTQCDCSNVPHFYIILLILSFKNNHIALILLLQYQCQDLILFNVNNLHVHVSDLIQLYLLSKNEWIVQIRCESILWLCTITCFNMQFWNRN